MSLGATVRNSARLANERKVGDLAERLDAIRTQEIQNSGQLVEAFRPLVAMLADLLQEVDSGRAQTADMLDRMQSALNRMEFAMGEAPGQLQQAVASSTEGQAERLGAVAEAMERLSQTFRRRLAEGVTSAGQTGKALQAARQDVVSLLPRMEAATEAMREAAEEAGRRKLVGPLAMVVCTGLLTSLLSAWLVCRTLGYALRLWP
jgi:methyl-accepting chemotaxis protein